jgi:hypothetical protein
MPDESLKSENAFSVLHLSETLKLCCQSAICNLTPRGLSSSLRALSAASKSESDRHRQEDGVP